MAIERFDLYGAKGVNLDSVVSGIEESLGIRLAEHESSYRGGIYFRGEASGCEIVVQRNVEDEDGSKAESGFDAYGVLVYADSVDEATSLRLGRVEGIVLLRSDLA
ncbi:hypothetical protein [Streptomyces sp. SS162]|uniref:hypothetical protein n=1 Tax=Streptomyces sp. SS162 TaxID=3108484 RepID=UPI002F40A905